MSETIDSLLAKLKAERDRLDAVIKEIEKYSGGHLSKTSDVPHFDPKIPRSAFRKPLSISKGAKKYLRMVKAKQTTREIKDALEKGGRKVRTNVLYGVLKREQKVKGDVVRIGDYWGLREWNLEH